MGRHVRPIFEDLLPVARRLLFPTPKTHIPKSMKKKSAIQRGRRGAIAILAFSSFIPAIAYAQTTGWNKPDDTTANDYNDTANWVGGTINGIWDPSLTLTSAQTAKFAADTVLTGGLTFNYTGNFDVTLRADDASAAAKSLTLGGNISVSPTSNRIINFGSLTAIQGLNVNLGATAHSPSAPARW